MGIYIARKCHKYAPIWSHLLRQKHRVYKTNPFSWFSVFSPPGEKTRSSFSWCFSNLFCCSELLFTTEKNKKQTHLPTPRNTTPSALDQPPLQPGAPTLSERVPLPAPPGLMSLDGSTKRFGWRKTIWWGLLRAGLPFSLGMITISLFGPLDVQGTGC